MIRFDRASKRYPNGREALSAASFEINGGEMVFLTGRSGAGKSTILKLVSLLERPTRGLVMVNGHNTAALSSRKIPAFRRELGVVFQDHRLLPERSIFDNVALPLHASEIGLTLKEIDKRVRAALDQVGLLDRATSLPLELSVGEQQRVGIARAVVGKPKLIIADEPTGNLDPALSLEVMGVFRRFNDVGVTVVIATHDLDIVKAWNLRELQVAEGRVHDNQAGEFKLPVMEAQR
jgi:cell division transport system ATP-binding protein